MNIDDLKDKSVLIIGCPASGKTFLSDKFKQAGFDVIHTDDYISYGFNDSLYELLKDIDGKDLKNTVIEGVIGYRLLRKGQELNSYSPDVVIELKPEIDLVQSRYAASRGIDKFKSVLSMINANETVLNQYKRFAKKKPEWVTIKNSEEI